MKIEYTKTNPRYFDMNGQEIQEGDIVLLSGKELEVVHTEDGYLGTDATNPRWIEIGRAVPFEFGVYAFDPDDEPVIVKKKIS